LSFKLTIISLYNNKYRNGSSFYNIYILVWIDMFI
jgi:hypothetical protein